MAVVREGWEAPGGAAIRLGRAFMMLDDQVGGCRSHGCAPGQPQGPPGSPLAAWEVGGQWRAEPKSKAVRALWGAVPSNRPIQGPTGLLEAVESSLRDHGSLVPDSVKNSPSI
jgi:hypothetical protein